MSILIRILTLLFTVSIATARADGPDRQSPADLAAARAQVTRDFAHAVLPESLSDLQKAILLTGVAYVDPGHLVPPDLLQAALVYFQANKTSFANQDYITVVDFKPRSDSYRFFVVNMTDGSVEEFHTSHGIGSDPKETGTAQVFGNVPDSNMSSLGFIRTAELYTGTYGVAMRIDGLSDTNSNIRDRSIVVHGWDGVKEANVIEGYSEGCMALDPRVKDSVINVLGGGSLMYAGVSGNDAPSND